MAAFLFGFEIGALPRVAMVRIHRSNRRGRMFRNQRPQRSRGCCFQQIRVACEVNVAANVL